MPKTIERGPADAIGRVRSVVKGGTVTRKSRLSRVAKTGKFVVVSADRFAAVMTAAAQSGLLGEKSSRIGGRISPALLEQARKQTGIQADSDLIEFALANVALDDNFGETFEKIRGTVDPKLKLGF